MKTNNKNNINLKTELHRLKRINGKNGIKKNENKIKLKLQRIEYNLYKEAIQERLISQTFKGNVYLVIKYPLDIQKYEKEEILIENVKEDITWLLKKGLKGLPLEEIYWTIAFEDYSKRIGEKKENRNLNLDKVYYNFFINSKKTKKTEKENELELKLELELELLINENWLKYIKNKYNYEKKINK